MSRYESTHADECLVEACLQGDRDAFGALVTKYQSLVYGVCYNMTGNPIEAEDLSQETFLKAYIQLHALRDASKFANWMYRIAVNVCRMWGRQRERESSLVQSLTESASEAVEPESTSPYESEDVFRAVNTLSHENRLAVRLYYMSGMNSKQISQFLGISLDAVKSRLCQARKQLRKQLRKEIEAMLQDGYKAPAPNDGFKDTVLAIVDDWVEKYSEQDNVLGVAAIGELALDQFRADTGVIDLLYLKEESEGPQTIGGLDRGIFVSPHHVTVEELQAIACSTEDFYNTLASGVPVCNLLYDAQIYYDPEGWLARTKAYVRQHRFSEAVTQGIAQLNHTKGETRLEKYRQAATAEDWAASMWHLQRAAGFFTTGLLEKHGHMVWPSLYLRYPELVQEVSVAAGVPQLYSWFIKTHRLGKGKVEAEKAMQQMERILHEQRIRYIDPFSEMVGKHCTEQVPRGMLYKAFSLGKTWDVSFWQFRTVLQPCINAGNYDQAILSLWAWVMYGGILNIPFLFESIIKGQEIPQDRPDFIRALGELDCMNDNLYQLILQFYGLEDASGAVVAETFKIVEQIAVLL